jgi:hypothetical protein
MRQFTLNPQPAVPAQRILELPSVAPPQYIVTTGPAGYSLRPVAYDSGGAKDMGTRRVSLFRAGRT